MNRWSIVIPNWCPPSLNKGRGRHFSKGDKCVNEVVEYVTAYNATAACPKVGVAEEDYRPRRRVTVVVLKRPPLPDPDNLLKYLLDGLKRAALIVDDSGKWCQWSTPEVGTAVRGEKTGTVITIEDIDDEPEAPVQLERAETFFSQLSRLVSESQAVDIASVVHDVGCRLLDERTWGGIKFTRAKVVTRPYYRPFDTSTQSVADFHLLYAFGGGECCWLSHPACTQFQLDERVKWAEAMGVPIDREEYTPTEPAKRAAVAHDTDLFG